VVLRPTPSYDQDVIDAGTGDSMQHHAAPFGRPEFSERELQVLEAASQGFTNAQIAQQLEVTVHTVKFHLASVYRKLNATNRTEAIVRWLRQPRPEET
jgi:DNA-binding NarL/FixJ family response regulator